jgi:hypothetical protein
LISLSPLSSAHPSCFQPTPVRSSLWCYPEFNLAKDRSPTFASIPHDLSPYSDLLSLRLPVLTVNLTPCRMTSRLIKQKARSHPACAGLLLFVSIRFQVLFTPLTGVLFTFPSRYWFTIGRRRVFSLGGWSPRIPTGFLVPRGTWDTDQRSLSFRLQDYHLLWLFFPEYSARMGFGDSAAPSSRRPSVPRPRVHNALELDMDTVWAVPRSLAATWGITVVFFSSGY